MPLVLRSIKRDTAIVCYVSLRNADGIWIVNIPGFTEEKAELLLAAIAKAKDSVASRLGTAEVTLSITELNGIPVTGELHDILMSYGLAEQYESDARSKEAELVQRLQPFGISTVRVKEIIKEPQPGLEDATRSVLTIATRGIPLHIKTKWCPVLGVVLGVLTVYYMKRNDILPTNIVSVTGLLTGEFPIILAAIAIWSTLKAAIAVVRADAAMFKERAETVKALYQAETIERIDHYVSMLARGFAVGAMVTYAICRSSTIFGRIFATLLLFALIVVFIKLRPPKNGRGSKWLKLS
jgi:hypothetical protein